VKSATTVKVLSWLSLICGVLGLAASIVGDPSPMPAVTLIGFAMAGFAFLAHLETRS
jgi:hypothetical protein